MPKGPVSRFPTEDAGVHGAVVTGVWDRNRDVPGLAVNILVAGNGGDLQIAAGEMDGEVRGRRNFHRRREIAVRRVFDDQIRMRAACVQIGGGIAVVTRKRNADMFIRAGADRVIAAIQLHFDASSGGKRLVGLHNRRLLRSQRTRNESHRGQQNEERSRFHRGPAKRDLHASLLSFEVYMSPRL